MAQQQQITIDRLLNQAPDNPAAVLAALSQRPDLASARDANGYSLVHAASSYNQLSLLRALVQQYGADVNMRDDDNETPLFAAETVEAAQCLVEELGADQAARNHDGQTPEDKIDAEADFPLVAAYLRTRAGGDPNAAAHVVNNAAADGQQLRHPPPLPNGIKVNMSQVVEDAPEDVGEVDPEFRRRIDELAARDDFQSDEGQAQLRQLVMEALGGMKSEGDRDAQRRRVE
ncbi:uncharacterized protein K452DRAFT_283932 [Aplosporella prunicola CBS 121167]|uniref:Uncharacterized protein n=1 Tax=Aplosporella prunicola CBS 121167 TaxID=1176127 RepID=A0A6A6BN70_9PEZI|nr:uncharacterized protein K452DRAFT_283932 [Aplosporella prunicola CBS 121167]KAF2145580.1 hypothetical protein K452DRAFT_283932 [Aplosporella prunicola CBS 121167]